MSVNGSSEAKHKQSVYSVVWNELNGYIPMLLLYYVLTYRPAMVFLRHVVDMSLNPLRNWCEKVSTSPAACWLTTVEMRGRERAFVCGIGLVPLSPFSL